VVLLDLWGNQADASLFTLDAIGSAGKDSSDSKLISDSTGDVWEALNRDPKVQDKRKVVFFNDNTGLEIVSDLCLAYYLLKSNKVETVEFKVKPYPFFVSDATPADVKATIDYIADLDNSSAKKVGEELRQYFHSGDLVVKSEV